MVKVTLAQPRTRPSSQPLASLNVQYSPEQFGAGLGKALQSFSGALEVSQGNKLQTQKFDSLTNYSAFESNMSLRLEKLKQDTPENAANFFEQAEAAYMQERATFLNNVPAELQPEFEAKAEDLKRRTIADAFKFNYAQQGVYFDAKINKILNGEKVGLEQAPETLEDRRKTVYELIDASGLSELDKAKQKRTAASQLEAISYKADVRKAKTRSLAAPVSGIAATNLPPVAGGILAAIAKRESGGKYDVRFGGADGPQKVNSFTDHPRKFAINPADGTRSSASGKYQFIEGTWDAAARLAGVKDFSPESQDMAGWAWAQKTVRAHSGKSIDELVAAGNFGTIKAALGTQWEGVKHMSIKEFTEVFEANSGVYGDYANIENNPSYDNLSFDDRQALAADAEREATGEYAAQVKARKASDDAAINTLYNNLYDGKAGRADIEALQDAGILSDYDARLKADKILNDVNNEAQMRIKAQSKIDTGLLWSPQDTDDKNMANSVFGEDGAAAISNKSEDYVSSSMLPFFGKTGVLAPNAVNLLGSQANGNDAVSGAFALETLRQLRETNPLAFAAQVPDELQKQVDRFSYRRNSLSPEEAAIAAQGRGLNPADRQAQEMMRDIARKTLNDSKFNVLATASSIFDGYFDGYGGEAPTAPSGRAQLSTDYRTLYEDNFVAANGDAELAAQLTADQLKRMWTLSDIGGATSLQRFPPETAGYQPINGDFSWIDQSVREQLGFDPDTPFQLVSDEQTEKEIMQKRAGQDVLPSYYVYYKGKDEQWHMAMTEDGQLAGINFEPSKAVLAEQEATFRSKQELSDEESIIRQYHKATREQVSRNRYEKNLEVAPELQQAYDDVIATREARDKAFREDLIAPTEGDSPFGERGPAPTPAPKKVRKQISRNRYKMVDEGTK
jgi:muramidase (phage lysozyme)